VESELILDAAARFLLPGSALLRPGRPTTGGGRGRIYLAIAGEFLEPGNRWVMFVGRLCGGYGAISVGARTSLGIAQNPTPHPH